MILPILFLAQVSNAEIPLPSFLAGCWEEKRPGGWTEECWTGPRGGLMIGSGRAGQADSVTHWEWMRIERATDGSVSFHASPKGAAPVSFKATAGDGRSITFVNATHEYPQRVRYWITPSGVDAEISLADGSKPNRWSYQRPGLPSSD